MENPKMFFLEFLEILVQPVMPRVPTVEYQSKDVVS
jgi:hypothetical protein